MHKHEKTSLRDRTRQNYHSERFMSTANTFIKAAYGHLLCTLTNRTVILLQNLCKIFPYVRPFLNFSSVRHTCSMGRFRKSLSPCSILVKTWQNCIIFMLMKTLQSFILCFILLHPNYLSLDAGAALLWTLTLSFTVLLHLFLPLLKKKIVLKYKTDRARII